MSHRSFLHVGCGPARKGSRTPGFDTLDWREIRLDIDPTVTPDVVASLTDMSAVETASADAIYSSHNIEHLYPHEVPIALAEFRRVLKDDGYAVITCPDVQSIAQFVAQNGIDAVAYQSGMGPITPLDMLYGHNTSMARGNLYMAHRTAFTRESLARALGRAGFGSVVAFSKPTKFELWAIGAKTEISREILMTHAEVHVPGFVMPKSDQAALWDKTLATLNRRSEPMADPL